MKTLFVATALMAAFFSAGCQVPGKVVSETEVCPVCPKCRNVTTTGVVKGTTVTKFVCSVCKLEYVDPRIQPYLDTGASAYSCKNCQLNVKTCEECAKK